MTYKILAAAVAISFGLGTAALAQATGDSNPDDGAATLPNNSGNSPVRPAWDTTINEAFYSDADGTQLRTQEEITTNWGNLSAEQQAMVRTDCDATTASVETKPGEASPDADAQASMTELCDMIGDM